MANTKNTYYVRREQGLCVSCGGERDTKLFNCKPCRTEEKDRAERNREEKGSDLTARRRKMNGLCPTCGNAPEPGKRMCRPCLDRKCGLVKKRAKANRRLGLCECGEMPRVGYAVCDECAMRCRDKQARRKVAGLCMRCKEVATPGATMCESCRNRGRVLCRDYYGKNKKMVFDHYGRKCQCCGELETEFLSIDHIDGGGSQQRKSDGWDGDFYGWIVRNGFPDNLRTLCMNCNFGRRKTGICPHEQARLTASAKT